MKNINLDVKKKLIAKYLVKDLPKYPKIDPINGKNSIAYSI